MAVLADSSVCHFTARLRQLRPGGAAVQPDAPLRVRQRRLQPRLRLRQQGAPAGGKKEKICVTLMGDGRWCGLLPRQPSRPAVPRARQRGFGGSKRRFDLFCGFPSRQKQTAQRVICMRFIASSPSLFLRQEQTFHIDSRSESGKGRCSFNPRVNTVSIMLSRS